MPLSAASIYVTTNTLAGAGNFTTTGGSGLTNRGAAVFSLPCSCTDSPEGRF
jgi:hypothetical protein